MNTINLEKALALTGALVVLIGVSAAASTAFADETTTVENQAVVAESAQTIQTINESANREAAKSIEEAILTVRLDNELDLDIRLLDHMSQTAKKL